MLGEVGQMALILALILAIVQTVVPTIGLQRNDGTLISVARTAAYLQFLMLIVSFTALVAAFMVSDFSIYTVYKNSHTLKPMLYKFAGTWGNHEGSLLLWALVLTAFGAAVAHYGRSMPTTFQARVLVVQAGVSVGFLLFCLLTSNPFLRVLPIPVEGRGLNPLLQDPGLAFHPPFLYLGYVGFSIAFSFAIAALWQGRVGPEWARWVRPWTLLAWVFLTIGIALGSLWAYYELGWGGWWFWDPVENASLMPWLLGTALLHSAIVVEKRDSLKSWTILLAILTFSTSLLGTFLVRSGVLTSVHAFAVDPDRGMFILIYLLVVTGGGLALFAWRAGTLRSGGGFKPVSREGFLVLNNALLTAVTAVVLIGTLYPLFLDALIGEKITVGPPYFNKTVLPLLAPLFVAVALATVMPWKRGDIRDAADHLKVGLLGAVIMLATIIALYGWGKTLAALAAAIGVWVMFGAVADWAKRVRFPAVGLNLALRRTRHLPASAWGVILGHFGLGVMVTAIAIAEGWTINYVGRVADNESVRVGQYSIVVESVVPSQGDNYSELRARVVATRDDGLVTVLTPAIRSYSQPPMTTTEASIELLPTGHLYVAIGDPAPEQGTLGLRVQIKPMMSWLWWGCLIMVLGGTISLFDRRLRLGAPKARTVPQSAVPAE